MKNYIVEDYIVDADGKVCEYFILSCNNHGVFYDMPTFLTEMVQKSFYGICWVDNYLASESRSRRFWKLEITKDDVVLTQVTDKTQCQLLKKQSAKTYSHHYAICDVSHLQPATLFCFKKGLL